MPESQTLEWKSSWRDDHLKWVCGFANAEGGTLVIGRDDRGKLVGLPNARFLLEELPNKFRDLLGIMAEVNLREDGGKEYLEIGVPAYPNPISYRGRYYQRSGSTLQEIKGAALDRFLLRRFGRTWDGSPLPGLNAADLSPQAFAQFRALARTSGRLDASALAEPDAELLDKLKLMEGRYLKRAAALLFHPDPLRFVTGAFVKIGFFQSESEIAYHDEVNGDLFTQAQKTLEILFFKYLKASIRYEDIVRVERYPVPRPALREALLNALIHRDYMIPAPIQIRVYDHKLMIWNPATLPEGWTESDLLAPHNSRPLNPDIANTFFRAGGIEAWGRGIERIFEACREAGTPPPRLRFSGSDLLTEFAFSDEYLQLMAGTRTGAEEKTPSETRVETRVKTRVKTPDRLLELLREQPTLSLSAAASTLGKSVAAIELVARNLRTEGRLRHTGPKKGGHWEVLK
ncbi:MAG: putative DNA binding domain-containing protein [Desulfovibrio sp.]|jgi:ATP-dependent DNA helicase RecG|nr:putative DNA binding domain-containing protein [Desulfovibrio sp.]